MAVDFDTFLEWAKDRFGEANIKIRNTAHGTEICTHSFYAQRKGIDDHKYHLWMNPTGGKSKHPDKGSFRCWYTDTMGSLVHLVADFDNIDYSEAEELICGVTSLRSLEEKVHEFFGHKTEVAKTEALSEPESKTVTLPDFTYLIDKMAPTHFMRIKARQYLGARKIPTEGLYVCTEGDYKNRIIIPWYNWDGDLIFFNARLMYDKKGALRYMKAKNVPQDDVLFMTEWPRAGTKIYIMEGEFDALSLKQAGLVACALGGKSISDTQIEMIRQYDPVLAFDADKGEFKEDTGLQALINVGMTLLERGFHKVSYVRPPKIYKDWNKLLVERNAPTIKAYVERFEKPFTSSTPDLLLAAKL
jgi:hypothetical protein